MKRNDVKILDKKTIHSGYCSVERYSLKNRLFDGKWSAPYDREVVRRLNAVAVLPYDPLNNKVVLIEQFRVGALLGTICDSPWLIELVAGVMDREENIESLARREMKEESGLEVFDLIPIYHYFASPGGSSEEVVIFCAKVDSTKAPEFTGVSDENEDIKVHVLDVKEAFLALSSGKINNAATIIALQWLELHLSVVNDKWG